MSCAQWEMKIGDSVYVQGYIDEIRKDTIIIHNDGGYFGSVTENIVPREKVKEYWRATERCRILQIIDDVKADSNKGYMFDMVDEIKDRVKALEGEKE